MTDSLFILLFALALDAVAGDFPWLFRRIPHPISVLGSMIGSLDRKLNRPDRSKRARTIRGFITVVFVVGISACCGWGIQLVGEAVHYGWVVEVVCVSILIAQRGLYLHVRDVAIALETGGLAAAQKAVGKIVGRDVSRLDDPGVARGAIESLAENFADGVMGPVLAYAIFGLPGLCAYKAINTLDSMIGYKSPKYLEFGMVAARLDDLVNLVPARVSGLLLSIAGLFTPTADPSAALRTMWKFADLHDSPNAGWPEAATAGALGLSLGGPREYAGHRTKAVWLGNGRRDVTSGDIRRGLVLFSVACLLNGLAVALAALYGLS